MNNFIETALNIKDRFKRMLFTAAVITKELEQYSLKPVIIGGCALEFYTFGGYNTFDIDVALPETDDYHNVMKKYGFEKEGRFWIHNKLGIMFEAPTSNLEGEEAEIVKVEIEKELYVYFIGIEDLIIDRLNGYVHWKYKDDYRWAKRLLVLHYKNIDMEYLRKKSVENKIEKGFKELCDEVSEI